MPIEPAGILTLGVFNRFKKSLGMNAKKRIDVHFDNDETVKQTINVYRDLLSV